MILSEKTVVTETVTITIPGLRTPRTFLHISDAHITHAYPGDSAEETDFAVRHAEKWNEAGIPPVDAFRNFLEFAAERKPDAVLFAGDMIDYYTKSNVRFLKEMLADFPVEYLYVWGNHENGSYGLPLPEINEIKADIAPLMNNETDFFVRDFEDFLIVGVRNSSFDITESQMDHMKNIIADGRPILLLMHVPIKTDAFSKIAWSMFDDETDTTDRAREFSDLIRRDDSNVAAIIAGHEHFAWSGEFAPGRMQYISAPCFRRFVREICVESV